MRDLLSSADDIGRAFFDVNTSSPDNSTQPVSSPTHPLSSLATSPSQPLATSQEPLYPSSTSLATYYPFTHSPERHPELHPDLHSSPQPTGPRRSSRFHRQNVRLDDYVLSISVDDFDLYLTKVAPPLSTSALTFHQATQHAGWEDAMKDEMQPINKNHT